MASDKLVSVHEQYSMLYIYVRKTEYALFFNFLLAQLLSVT